MPHLHVALDGSFYGAHIHTSQAGPEMDATLSSGGIPIHGWHWAGSSTAKGDTSDLLRTQCALLCRPARTARSSSSSRTVVVAAADASHFHDSGEVPGSKPMFRSVRRSAAALSAPGDGHGSHKLQVACSLSRLRNRVPTLHSTVQAHGPA